jgi:hypothetical protein
LLDANCRANGERPALIASHVDLVAKVMGTADAAAGVVSKQDGMRDSSLKR